ncbi:GNAT family N-acetyltransferase [Streptosporangium carneum]|uniref:GNAT family N-acetyltransferase n=1 Tax=Streptosporangium carneum TaxID=47481 RepID=UPI0022F2F7BC|nr:GNAT family N-acetyltransferase [Streptosporangium carneum]
MMVVEAPQWQGSSSATAHRLEQGASLLAAMVPDAERVRVPTGPTLTETAARIRAALSRARGRLVVTAGGDCGVELEPVAAAVRRHGDRLAVVWFDAHGDLNTPGSSPSGAFHGMVLRALLGDGPPGLTPVPALRPEQVVLAGVRALDPAERDHVRAEGIAHARVDELSALEDLVARTGAEAVYVHVDLDVLDPDVFPFVGVPEPGGILPAELLARVTALAERFEIAGLGITEYEPSRKRADGMLAGLVAGLVEACRTSAVRQIERRAAAAWPAAVVEEEHGWLLRHTPGVTRQRCNSALPPLPWPLAGGFEHVERFYGERGLPVRVQVSPAERHRELDEFLAARGYRHGGATAVLTAATQDVIAATTTGTGAATTATGIAVPATAEDVTAVAVPGEGAVRASPPPVDLTDEPGSWFGVFAELDGHDDSAAVCAEVVSRIASPAAFLSVTLEGRAAGMGLFVADRGWAGVFCMATAPELRRRGVATALLGAGARWAREMGADRLYLQVERDNEAAVRLYAQAGFVHSHGYHYRVGS